VRGRTEGTREVRVEGFQGDVERQGLGTGQNVSRENIEVAHYKEVYKKV